MVMREVSTIPFTDTTSGDRGVIVVRAAPTGVGVSVSLEHDGDIEVFLEFSAIEQIVDALQEAVRLARGAA